MKKELKGRIIATIGVLVAIGVALLISAYVGDKDVKHSNYGNTIIHTPAKKSNS